MGIGFTYLSKIENGRMDPPSEEVLRRMSVALGLDEWELVLRAEKVPEEARLWLTRFSPKELRVRLGMGL